MSDPYVGGKGDNRRPEDVNKFGAGYESIFNPDPEERAKYLRIWRKLNGKDSDNVTTD